MIDNKIDTNTKKSYYLLGVESFPIQNNDFVIYQGHHGDNLANKADVILPGSAYTEKHSTNVNLEGRVQQSKFILNPPGDARTD